MYAYDGKARWLNMIYAYDDKAGCTDTMIKYGVRIGSTSWLRFGAVWENENCLPFYYATWSKYFFIVDNAVKQVYHPGVVKHAYLLAGTFFPEDSTPACGAVRT